MNNLKRLKKLVLANKETRRLYRMMQFLAIFMVISCTIIVVVAKWIEQDQNQKREELFGSWDEVFLDVPAEDLNYFKQNAFLEQISIQSIQEKVFLEGDKRVVIGSCDDNFLEMGNIELLEGRMPEKENEVAVEEEYLEILGVGKIGETISNKTNVYQLRGYRLSGILSNYSREWKVINPTTNYINCFIDGSHSGTIQVYVEYSQYYMNDIDINMLHYKVNIPHYDVNEMKLIIRYIRAILIIECILAFKLYTSIRRVDFCKKIHFSNYFYTISISLLSLLYSISIMEIINEIYFKQETIKYISEYYNFFNIDNLNIYYITSYYTMRLIGCSNKLNVFFYLNFILIEILNVIRLF